MTVKSYALFPGKAVRLFLLAVLLLGTASFMFSSMHVAAQQPGTDVPTPAATDQPVEAIAGSIMTRYDSDMDGVLSESEINASPDSSRMQAADTDQDGCDDCSSGQFGIIRGSWHGYGWTDNCLQVEFNH